MEENVFFKKEMVRMERMLKIKDENILQWQQKFENKCKEFVEIEKKTEIKIKNLEEDKKGV